MCGERFSQLTPGIVYQATEAAMDAYGRRRQVVKSDKDTVVSV